MQIRSQDQHFPFSYRLNLDQTRSGMPCILDVAGRRIGNANWVDYNPILLVNGIYIYNVVVINVVIYIYIPSFIFVSKV